MAEDHPAETGAEEAAAVSKTAVSARRAAGSGSARRVPAKRCEGPARSPDPETPDPEPSSPLGRRHSKRTPASRSEPRRPTGSGRQDGRWTQRLCGLRGWVAPTARPARRQRPRPARAATREAAAQARRRQPRAGLRNARIAARLDSAGPPSGRAGRRPQWLRPPWPLSRRSTSRSDHRLPPAARPTPSGGAWRPTAEAVPAAAPAKRRP